MPMHTIIVEYRDPKKQRALVIYEPPSAAQVIAGSLARTALGRDDIATVTVWADDEGRQVPTVYYRSPGSAV